MSLVVGVLVLLAMAIALASWVERRITRAYWAGGTTSASARRFGGASITGWDQARRTIADIKGDDHVRSGQV